jgi:hypothetical protein
VKITSLERTHTQLVIEYMRDGTVSQADCVAAQHEPLGSVVPGEGRWWRLGGGCCRSFADAVAGCNGRTRPEWGRKGLEGVAVTPEHADDLVLI